jgi:hypothetical protein
MLGDDVVVVWVWLASHAAYEADVEVLGSMTSREFIAAE